MNRKQKNMLTRIIIAIILVIILRFLPLDEPYRLVGFMVPYLVVGYDILKKAVHNILNREVFDENFLMAVATIGAVCLGEYTEAVAVMLFYQIGELFQSYAVGKSRRNISALMDIRPDYANVEIDGDLQQVDPDEVETGTVIVVMPGEKVPIDGVVVKGSSHLDTSALTGESVPRSVNVGDEIISGCICLDGLLNIETTKEFGDSTVSKILDLVENASSRKARSEQFITRFAHYYTPAVCYSALALGLGVPLINLLLGRPSDFSTWIYRALTFLVISCPCALVISIPLSFFAGIGAASSKGILVKGSNFLEQLNEVRTLVFDKTGTVTKGVFEVTAVHAEAGYEEKLLEYAAYCEYYSSHPISSSIKKAYGQEIDEKRIDDFQNISGQGIKAVIDEVNVACGNDKLMKAHGIIPEEPDNIGTVVYVSVDGKYAGYIIVSDVIKENASEAFDSLKTMGVNELIMLTGDRKVTSDKVGEILGISQVYSELLPEDKVTRLEEVLERTSDKVAFVGDGINDAPALSRADLGIAMGAMGSDAAIEAADIVLMDDDISKLALAIRIARKCLKIVYENIYFAIGVKLLCLVLGALGIGNMWLAIFADVGVMVLAVINAIRVLKV